MQYQASNDNAERSQPWLAFLLAMLIAIGAMPLQPAFAADEYITYKAKCLVEIKGKAYLDGPCKYVEGPRIIFVTPPGTRAEIRRLGSFTVRIREDGTGIALVNWPNRLGDHRSAKSDLGDVTLDVVTSCWTNDRVRICAWR